MPYKTEKPEIVIAGEKMKEAIIREMVIRYRSKGFTRESIAVALELPPSSVLRMEKGTYKLPLDRFLAICLFIEEDPIDIMRRASAGRH